MLKFLRKKGNLKKIMWGLAILIIPAFVLWGSGSAVRSRGQPKYAGKIFGKKVSFRQYSEALLACRNQGLLIYGEGFNKIAKYLDLEEQAWERLILLEQAKKEDLQVPDKEVIDFIERPPLFQKQGRFNRDRYNTLLDYLFRLSPRAFEEQIRESLIIDKLKNEVTSYVSVSDEEIKKEYKNENEKAKAYYVLIESQRFEEQVHPSYEELQDYYQKRKTEFKVPEQVKVQYIALYLDEKAYPEIEITEEEMENFYQGHREEFSAKDKKGKVSIRPLEEVKIQIKERLARDKAKAILEDRIWQISDEIGDTPELFSEVGERNEIEVKETGFFGPQKAIAEIGLSYEFLNAAFSLKIGEVSNVIETSKGYFIIKVKEKKEPHIPPLDAIKEKVQTGVVEQSSRQLAKKKGQETALQIKNMMQEKKLDFPKAAEKLSLAVKETEGFTRFSYISGIGQSRELSQAAFELEPGGVSDLIEVPNGYCILSLKDIVPIEEEKFKQEKEEFAKNLLARKKEAFYKFWLSNLKKEANLVSNIN